MNIRDLEYLVALSEYKHFRKAADACHVSQPTLSGQIRKLEDELGILLLERTSRKVLFTQSGMLLVDQARKILLEVQIFREMASNQGKEMSGPLHIGVIPTLGPYLLPCMLPVLEQDFPELELYLYEAQTQNLLEKLEMGQLDCAILAQVPETANFIEVPMFKEEMMLAVSPKHEWAKERSLALSVLKNHEILMLDDGHCLREQAMDYCFTAGARENSHFQATSLETLRNMVAANTGVTLMPKLAIINEGNRQGVEYIPFSEPRPHRGIILVYRPGSPLRARYERIAKIIQAAVMPMLS
ncbi:LysR family transcriptional regulator, hydrogen peroxide-inducible genes activator [Pasteurella testudinis DSM 23072]|uniref:LysR family transcriptional regulator, hydrogen peroxide-inducible genes activator n=1 Tax=Pasteurella testudinis DSM 23072 TaxID=1122938 RepID=A0A1W1USU9_9PAST|nr:DNA-binding transcriptional regulator OxyR [Pasteurella testudinis]SMB84218.1 LysR family transcriptional regulator, hydrogen peroxide-inducible genes activator [Pasteurella testudinis DSM 23072]SUB50876.1 hydrogen peroxide-inducible genes activator [Pasteurella testudinis]